MGNIILKITALVFGIALWFIVISHKDFQLSMEVPVIYTKLPESMSIASKPPQKMHITIQGKSWDLIRLQHQIKQADKNVVSMVVDLQKIELGSTRIDLGENNFFAPNFPEVSFTEPSNQRLFIDLDVDTRITRNIPIRTNTTFTAAQGYLLADEPKVFPEELVVSGARNALTRIIDIPTDSVRFDTLSAPSEFTIPLDFSSLPAFVYPSDSVVRISVDIQKMGSKTFNNIPVSLIGMFQNDSLYAYSLTPSTISVEITGGEKVLDSLSSNDIELIMEYNRFAIEDADSLAPTTKLILPPSVNREMSIKAIQLKPDKVTLKKSEKKTKESQGDSEEAAQ